METEDSVRIPKEERLINLLCFFYSKNEPVTIGEIKERVYGYQDDISDDALRQRLYRDISELEEMGIYIDYQSKNYGYQISKKTGKLSRIKFSSDEKLALVFLISALEYGGNFLYRDDLRKAFSKILLSTQSLKEFDFLAPVNIFCSIYSDLDEKIELIQESISSYWMKFQYRAFSAEDYSIYEVFPLGLYFKKGSWYLVALKDGNVRSFKLERMKKPEIIKNKTEPHDLPEIDLKKIAEKEPWQFGENQRHKVRLLVGRGILQLVNKRYPEAAIVEKNEKGTILEIYISSPDLFVSSVLDISDKIVVLEPDFIRNKLVEKIEILEKSI